MNQIHVIVTGHVQGVGFRYFTHTLALELNIKGWVKNRHDGSVEVIAAGHENELSSFISSLKDGNRFADVENVSVNPINDGKKYLDFVIKY